MRKRLLVAGVAVLVVAGPELVRPVRVAAACLVPLAAVGAVVIGFGSSFVYPLLGVKAKKLGPDDPKAAYAISHAGLEASKIVTTPFIYAAGVFGLGLVGLSDKVWQFSQAWVGIALLLWPNTEKARLTRGAGQQASALKGVVSPT